MHWLNPVDAHASHPRVEATVAEAAAAAVAAPAGDVLAHVTADEAAGAAAGGQAAGPLVMIAVAAVALLACAGPVLVA